MAENKKSFVLYADLIHTVRHLSKEDAGELFMHILSYVSDENPVTENPIVKISFEPVKQQLKRDLIKWDKQLNQRREAGKRSAEIRSTKANERSTVVDEIQQASTDNVNVNVNVNDTDNVINKERYTRPRDFLIQHNEIEFEDIVAKSMLADFESCIEQWSLAVEGGDFKYSDNKHEDYRKLKAQFQKWINSWRNNLSKIPAKATPTPVVAKIKVPEDFWSRSEYEKYCKENNIESKWD